MAGLYIHIPFCESRCIYCGFYSTTSLNMRDEYIKALGKEMELRPIEKALGEETTIETIYLGGGTPSQLTPEQLSRLFEHIQTQYGEHIGKHPEITMECNPDDITPQLCSAIAQLPINRISMGAQTFDNERLRFLHRRHNAEEVTQAVNMLRGIGIKNISIDMMFGFPSESLDEWKQDVEKAISLGVEHISAYSLMYEESTALYKMLEQEKVSEIDEDTYRQMYETLIDLLTQAGYEHYEISNFARKGFRSRHNSSYWNETPYIGIGAAAHSYSRKPVVTRSWNISNIRTYIEKIKQGELPSEQELLQIDTRFNDLITTALRTCEGINLRMAEKEFGEDIYEGMLKEAGKHIQLGLMQIKDGRLSLTRKGLYISDDIMSDFMIV